MEHLPVSCKRYLYLQLTTQELCGSLCIPLWNSVVKLFFQML